MSNLAHYACLMSNSRHLGAPCGPCDCPRAECEALTVPVCGPDRRHPYGRSEGTGLPTGPAPPACCSRRLPTASMSRTGWPTATPAASTRSATPPPCLRRPAAPRVGHPAPREPAARIRLAADCPEHRSQQLPRRGRHHLPVTGGRRLARRRGTRIRREPCRRPSGDSVVRHRHRRLWYSCFQPCSVGSRPLPVWWPLDRYPPRCVTPSGELGAIILKMPYGGAGARSRRVTEPPPPKSASVDFAPTEP